MGKKRTHSISSCGGGGEGCSRPSSPAASLPSFCKIILPAIILNKKLRIPENFAETYGNQLSSVVKLVIPDGRLWYVGLEKAAEMLWLSDHGWQQFVDHYSISCGDFLTFKYEGDSSFCVSIFDITSTEIHYPCRARGDLESDEEEVEDIEVLSDSSSGSSLGNGLQFDQCLKRDRNKVADIFKSGLIPPPTNPFFIARLRPRINRNELYIPVHVIRDHNLEIPDEMIIRDKKGNEFVSRTATWRDGRKMLTDGYRDFCVKNKVKTKDGFLSEFLSNQELLIRVLHFQAGNWVLRPRTSNLCVWREIYLKD